MFPVLEIETTVQTNDKTRLDASKSFGDFTKMEISPNGVVFFDVTNAKFLDWQYLSADEGDVEIKLKLSKGEDETLEEVQISKTLKVVSAETDNLISNDADLLAVEENIMRYLSDARNSFIDKHREAKKRILQTLDEQGIRLQNHSLFGGKVSDSVLLDMVALRDWSRYIVLSIIFESNASGDTEFFAKKAGMYRDLAVQASSKAVKRLDLNSDGKEDVEKTFDFSASMVRR